MRFLAWLVVNAAALGVAIWLFSGITLTADDTTDFVIRLALTGAIFGVVSSIVKPIVQLLSLPFIIITLGLALIVINALMLLLTSKLADSVGLGFHVEGFWTAVFGAIVISIAGLVIESVLPSRR